eukprot:TRINITY_DN14268_c0_g1_i1.p1 TRINITY_DN14268_c0_g1~~TRINITY_DN14268_c0_g1_i1.p1  ORF type:complete len:510 (-),score=151.64 TRINITY_DN14268_c0_g1_i1:87-1616(-)
MINSICEELAIYDEMGDVTVEEKEINGKIIQEKTEVKGNVETHVIFKDNAFKNANVKILILYLYPSPKTNEFVNVEAFKKNTGRIFRKLGIKYSIVFDFENALKLMAAKDYQQVWIICTNGPFNKNSNSTAYNYRKPFIKDVLIPFWRNGGGVCILADNEPIVSEAQCWFDHWEITKDLNIKVEGNYIGQKIVTSEDGNFRKPTAGNEYTLSTGINSMYEGNTICTLNKSIAEIEAIAGLEVFMKNSIDQIAVLTYANPDINHSHGRFVFDSGFTKLFHEIATYGVIAYVRNIVSWLLKPEYVKQNEKIPVVNFIFPETLELPNPGADTEYYFSGSSGNNSFGCAHYILVLDASGSMSRFLRDVEKGVHYFVENLLNTNSLISVVAFGSTSTILNERAAAENFGKIHLNDMGSTNFNSAFETAYSLMKRNKDTMACRVIFFSDGCPTCDGSYLKIAENIGEYCPIFTFGYGNVSEKALISIAKRSDGEYLEKIEKFEEFGEKLVECAQI